jgi:hypothetical protein
VDSRNAFDLPNLFLQKSFDFLDFYFYFSDFMFYFLILMYEVIPKLNAIQKEIIHHRDGGVDARHSFNFSFGSYIFLYCILFLNLSIR